MLQKKEAHLGGKILGLKKEAVGLKNSKRATDKKKALLKMKEIKMLELQQGQIGGNLQNMLAQKIAIEGMSMTNATVNVMEQSQAAMAAGVDLDHAEDVVADVQEQMERAAEVSAALAQPMDGGMMPMDDDELMDELAALENELLEEEPLPDLSSLEVASSPLSTPVSAEDILNDVPSAPTGFAPAAPAAPAAVANEMDDLMAWAN